MYAFNFFFKPLYQLLRVVPAISGFIMLAVVVFEDLVFSSTSSHSDTYILVLTGIELYRQQKAFKTMDRTQHEGPPLHLYVRVGIFSLYSVHALV